MLTGLWQCYLQAHDAHHLPPLRRSVALLILTPGPTMLMCMTNALNHGPRKAMTSVAGSVVCGAVRDAAVGHGPGRAAGGVRDRLHGAKVIGAAYLIWLGIKTFRSEAAVFDPPPVKRRRSAARSSCAASWSAPATPRPAVLRGLLPAVPEPGRALCAAVRPPRPDLHGL
jgi:threonine/homoserine/homoserine lactone efflux protein